MWVISVKTSTWEPTAAQYYMYGYMMKIIYIIRNGSEMQDIKLETEALVVKTYTGSPPFTMERFLKILNKTFTKRNPQNPFCFTPIKNNYALILFLFHRPDQAPLAVWGGAGGQHKRTAPKETASTDQGSVEGTQAEPGLRADGSPAAPGPTGEAAALPQRWKERYATRV